MRKLAFYLTFTCLACCLSFTAAGQPFFNTKSTSSNTKNQSRAVPQGKPVLSPEDFKKTVNDLNKQTQQGLKDQLKQDLSKQKIQKVGPPGTATVTTPTSSTVTTSRPSTPTSTALPPPPVAAPTQTYQPQPLPPQTVFTAPTNSQGQQNDVYTGFQGTPNQQQNQEQSGGGFNIRY